MFFLLTALKSPNYSVSRVTAASVAAAGLTTSRCYAHACPSPDTSETHVHRQSTRLR